MGRFGFSGSLHQLVEDLGNGFDLPVVQPNGFASRVNCSTNSPGVAIRRRSRTKMRMISMLTRTAVGERSTLESMATPCSVNAQGSFRWPPCPELDITFCDIKFVNSCWVS